MKNLFLLLRRHILALGVVALLPLAGGPAAVAAPTVERLAPMAVPFVGGFSPGSGVVGSTVEISGASFTGVTSVTFNNVPATVFTVNSSTSITAEVPVGASTGRIRVINSDGTGTSSSNFTVLQPPTITSFSPATARVGQTVTVNGQRLGSAFDVWLNGVSVAFTQVNASRITFVVPTGATSGSIAVSTPNGTATSANQFVVRPSQPVVSSFSPTSGAPGVTAVTITGTGFTGATEVRFGATPATTFTVNSDTQISTTVPVGAVSGRIRVITSGGTGVSSGNFTVSSAPTITSFTPTVAAVGSSVLIRGTGFVNVSSVLFNGTPASFTVLGAGRLRATVPASVTDGPITVTTPSGSATSTGSFTLNANAPTITSFNPPNGTPPPGPPALGTNVTINGTNFLGNAGTGVSNTQVFFNGTQATTVTFVSVTQVRARVPAGATTGPITVTTANGSALSANSFTVTGNTAPTIIGTADQRGCASSQLVISYTVGDSQTPVNDLVVTGSSPGDGTVITFNADASGTGANRTALVDAIDLVNGGSTTLTLTVTDGGGLTASQVFNITLDAIVTADAGSDQNVTANQPVALSGAATGPASVLWTTNGTGTFDDATALATNYNPSQADYLNNSVVLTLTASSTVSGSQCGSAADATLITFSRPDRIVTTAETVSGVYNNVLVTAGGALTVGAALDVAGSLTVQTGASLSGGADCAPITGTGSFTLEDGATLNICHPQGIAAGTAQVGQIRLTGGRSYGAGAAYAYVGSGAQSSGTGLPSNLTGSATVNNGGAGVSLTNTLNLRGELHLLDGNLTLVEMPLRVISDANGTGLVHNQNGVVQGAVQVQRYLDATRSTGLGYHHLSSPVAAAPIGDLTTSGFSPVVNGAFNPTANPRTIVPYPNIFFFDETRFPTSGIFGRGYVSPTATSELLEPGRGYSVYIASGLTPDFIGTLNNGSIARTGLTRTGNFTGTGQKSGWHLVGNPYPSPIDWDRQSSVPTGLSPVAFVWESTGGSNGAYRSLTFGGSLNTDLIGTGQGFWVRVTGTSSSFTFTNDLRLTSATPNVPVYRTAVATTPQLTLSLRATTAPAREAADASVRFLDGATAGFDELYDGARPARNVGVPTIATVVADEELAVNTLAPATLGAGARLPLLVDVPAAGSYELSVAELAGLADAEVYLTDALTGTAQRLAADTRYTFAAATAGEQAGRFALRFGSGAASAATADALTVWPNPATARAQVRLSAEARALTLVDALGRTVRVQTLAAGQTDATLDLAGLPAGVYTVRAGAATTRLVVE